MKTKAEVKLRAVIENDSYQFFEEKLIGFLMNATDDFLIDLVKFESVPDDFEFKSTD